MSIVLVAAICGLLYFGGTSKIGYHLTTAVGSPIFIGFVLGMIYGQVAQGLLIGATIQLVYLGVIATGGNVPADQALAATIAIPIALQTGMSAEVAVGLAVPFGVLGVFVDQIRRTSNSVWGRWADKFQMCYHISCNFWILFKIHSCICNQPGWCRSCILADGGTSAVDYYRFQRSRWTPSGTWICNYHYHDWQKRSAGILLYWILRCGISGNQYHGSSSIRRMYCCTGYN